MTEEELEFAQEHERLHAEMRAILGMTQEQYDAAMDALIDEMFKEDAA